MMEKEETFEIPPDKDNEKILKEEGAEENADKEKPVVDKAEDEY